MEILEIISIMHENKKVILQMFFTKKKYGLPVKLLESFEYRNDAELSDNLNDIEEQILQIFANCSDLIIRKITLADSTQILLVYLKVLVDDKRLEDGLMKHLMNIESLKSEFANGMMERLEQELIPMARAVVIDSMKDAVQRIVQGEAVVFAESANKSLAVSSPKKLQRELTEPNIETVIIGPQLGFIENMEVNLGLLRNRLRTPLLKIEKTSAGKMTQTPLALVYLEGRVSQQVIKEVQRRISSIEMDSVLDVGYIEELICDKTYSVFPLMKLTQRPDAVTAALIEGKFAIMVEGSSLALIAPVVFWFGFQVVEDYYMHFIIATQLRWLRLMFAFMALTLPSFYVAITTFHQEMIPTALALTLAASREVIPFPTVLETLMMEIIFDALREAGIRLPRPVGETISIVGALVIGQAAVQAGIISAPIVMIVSLTGIASFLIPFPKMSQAITILRFPMVLFAGMFGLYGIGMALIVLLIHLANLRSFGIPYLSPLTPFYRPGLLDTFIRAPWGLLSKRKDNIVQNMESE
jgi:spore germination protein KA